MKRLMLVVLGLAVMLFPTITIAGEVLGDSDESTQSEDVYKAPPLPSSRTRDIPGVKVYGQYVDATFAKVMALPRGPEKLKLWKHLIACGVAYYPYVRYDDTEYWSNVKGNYARLLKVLVYGYYYLGEYKKSYDWWVTSLYVKRPVGLSNAMKAKFESLIKNNWKAPARPFAPQIASPTRHITFGTVSGTVPVADSSSSVKPTVFPKGDLDQNGVLDNRDLDEFFESYPSLKTYKLPFLYPDSKFGSWLSGGFEVMAKESKSAYDPAFDFNQDKKIGLKDLFMLKALINCQTKK